MNNKIPDIVFVLEKDGFFEEFELYHDLLEFIFSQEKIIQSVLYDYNSEPHNKYTESVEDFLFRHLETYLGEAGYKFSKKAVYR
jgi:hypothetical protein